MCLILLSKGSRKGLVVPLRPGRNRQKGPRCASQTREKGSKRTSLCLSDRGRKGADGPRCASQTMGERGADRPRCASQTMGERREYEAQRGLLSSPTVKRVGQRSFLSSPTVKRVAGSRRGLSALHILPYVHEDSMLSYRPTVKRV